MRWTHEPAAVRCVVPPQGVRYKATPRVGWLGLGWLVRASSTLRQALRAGALVTEMAIAVVAGLWFGSWLDSRFDSSPLFALGLTTASFFAGLFVIYRAASSAQASTHEPPQNHS